jgi:hypothetical protein
MPRHEQTLADKRAIFTAAPKAAEARLPTFTETLEGGRPSASIRPPRPMQPFCCKGALLPRPNAKTWCSIGP